MLAWLFSPFRATRDVIQGQQYIYLRTYQGTSASAPGTTAPRNSRPIADHVWDNYKSKRSFFILQWIFYTQKWFRKNWGAWKTGLIINVLTTLLVLILNLSVPAWAARKYGTEGSYLYRGSCPQTERAGVIVDASINISGTLLLSASNYTMQILSAPTRKDVDRAHEKGTLLTIGLQSFNNLRLISIYRKVFWGLLAFSSIPLHLIYNSTVFQTTGEHSYMAVVVSSAFLDGYPFNTSAVGDPMASISNSPFSSGSVDISQEDAQHYSAPIPVNPDVYHRNLNAFQTRAQNKELIQLDNEKCLSLFANTSLPYWNLLAISDFALSNSSALWIDRINPNGKDSNMDWTCKLGASKSKTGASKFKTLIWGVGQDPECSKRLNLDGDTPWSLGLYTINGTLGSHPVSKCLLEQTGPPLCSLRYDKRLLLAVVVANIVKLSAMIGTLLHRKRPSLVTLGDGLASFLETPDPWTRDLALVKIDDIDTKSSSWPYGPRVYSEVQGKSTWSSGVSSKQWKVTLTISGFSMLGLMVFFVNIYEVTPFQLALSKTIRADAIKFGRGYDLGLLIVLANLPQLLLSFNYFLLNRIVTAMAASYEWSSFAHKRKGLRTSAPVGAQRSTFWPQLPLKFSLPMMVESFCLHYFASQTLYFGSLQTYASYDEHGNFVVLEDNSGLGYSHDAAYFLMVFLVIVIAGVIWCGYFQNKRGLPPCKSCSLLISAACHPSEEERDVHLKPVQWGEVSQATDSSEIGHCSFSGEEVTMPVIGRAYM